VPGTFVPHMPPAEAETEANTEAVATHLPSLKSAAAATLL